MAALFASIEDFKRCVSGAVDNDEDFLISIESDINNAALLHVIPWLGHKLYSHIVESYPADSESKEGVLIEKMQNVLAPLALYHASKTKGVRFGTHGMSQAENTPFRYKENDYRDEMLISGYEHLELMLGYLEDESVYFTEGAYEPRAWAAKDRHLSHFVRYAADFRQGSSYRVSRYTFEFLLPIIDDVEYHAVEVRLPLRFLSKLKNNVTSEAEKEVLRLLKSAIIEYTVVEALRRQLVKIEGGQLVQEQIATEQGSKRQSNAPLSASEKAHSWEGVASQRSWIRLMRHLESKTDFPLLYHTSVSGTNPDTDAWGYVPPLDPQIVIDKEGYFEKIKAKKVVSL